MTKIPETTKTAIAHGNYIRGSASKVRRVLDQIRGRSYRDALIMLEFMPYRSTDPITKVLRSAVANAEHISEWIHRPWLFPQHGLIVVL